jgi:hypothetical protein
MLADNGLHGGFSGQSRPRFFFVEQLQPLHSVSLKVEQIR